MSTPSDTIRTATSHGSDDEANCGDRGRSLRVVGGDEPGGGPEPPAKQRGDPAGMLAVGRDHEAARVRLLAAHLLQAAVRGAEHLGQPIALERERGPEPLAGAGRVEAVVEGRRVHGAVGRRPLHVAVRRREEDRPHDAPVGERVAVAVLEVGDGAVARVGDERDRAGVRAERRSREGEPPAGRRERNPGSPRPRLAPRRRDAARRARRTRRGRAARSSGAFVATWW